MKVTGYSRGRNGDASTISELTDEAGTVHPDRTTLPHETVREYTCKADVERANAELASIEDSDGDSDNEPAQVLAPNEGAVASDEEVTRALDMDEDERAAEGTAGAGDEPPAGAATGGATTANTVDSSRIDDVVDGWMHALSSLTGYLFAKGQGLIADFLPHSDAKPAKSTFIDPDSEPGLALLASSWDQLVGADAIRDIIRICSDEFPEFDYSRFPCHLCAALLNKNLVWVEESLIPLGVKKLTSAEYITSGMGAFGFLENVEVRREFVEVAERGFHLNAHYFHHGDCAWGQAGTIITSGLQKESALGTFTVVNLGFFKKEQDQTAMPGSYWAKNSLSDFTPEELVHYKSAEGRNGTCIGYNADFFYQRKLAHAVTHRQDPERHMVKLSKEAVKLFGHSFSDEGLFCVIDGAQRERLLLGVPAPCRRALRRIMAAEAKIARFPARRGAAKLTTPVFRLH
jgi:hypothetical protein